VNKYRGEIRVSASPAGGRRGVSDARGAVRRTCFRCSLPGCRGPLGIAVLVSHHMTVSPPCGAIEAGCDSGIGTGDVTAVRRGAQRGRNPLDTRIAAR